MARLLSELEKLPGVGPRTAERLAHHLLEASGDALELAKAIEAVVDSVHPCGRCGHVTDRDPCAICADPARDQRRLLVVEQPRDLEAMERAGWKGVYHVLHGSVRADGSPERAPDLERLRRRIEAGEVDEIVLGTDPDLEGDGTALEVESLVRASRRPEMPVSRLARGLPTGTPIEYANPAVLAEALSERRAFGRRGGEEAAP